MFMYFLIVSIVGLIYRGVSRDDESVLVARRWCTEFEAMGRRRNGSRDANYIQ